MNASEDNKLKIINVMAASLNGRIAAFPFEGDQARRDNGFTIPDDERLLREELLLADAVITGANSLRVTRSVSNTKNNKGVYPHWFIFTQKGLEPDLEFWAQVGIPRTIVSSQKTNLTTEQLAGSLSSLQIPQEKIGAELIGFMSKSQMRRVLLFGGGHINRIFYQENLVDELKLTVAPFVFTGADAPPLISDFEGEAIKFSLLSSHIGESHVFLHYKVIK